MLLFEQDIPIFLRPSPFLQALLSDGPFPDSGIEIPDGCLKKNLTILSQPDLARLLYTLRFWLLPEQLEFSDSLLQYALDPSNASDFLVCAEEFVHEFPIIKALKDVVSSQDRLEAAVLTGHMGMVQYLVERSKHSITEGAGVAAGRKGFSECLTYLHARGLILTPQVCTAACLSGDLSCVQYVTQHSKPSMLDTAAEDCAASGDFACLKFVIENAYNSHTNDIEDAFRVAAENGDLALLTQMRAEWQDPIHGKYDFAVVDGGAQNGQLEVLRWARQNNVAIQHFQSAVDSAATASDTLCLEYFYQLGCTADDEVVLEGAAHYGHLPVLQFLLEHNCPISGEVCTILAKNKHIDGLKYARERGCPWDSETCAAAAGSGSLECLEFAHEQGCHWSAQTCNMAARAGSLECLMYAHSHGCPWSAETCARAAHAGSLECLQYAHERGCPWGEYTCRAAAHAGSLECLRYAHENGCPWGEFICAAAAIAGRLHCLRYAREHGCPWKRVSVKSAGRCLQDISVSAALAETADCLIYVLEQGVPLHPKAAPTNKEVLQFMHACGYTTKKLARKELEGPYFIPFESNLLDRPLTRW